MRTDRSYHTMTFVYEVQELNESIFIAYDKPYTYSQDLKQLIDSVRDNKAYRPYLQVSTLCKSLGQNDVKMLTITDGIKDSLNYYESLQLFLKKEVRDRYMIRSDIEKMTDKERIGKIKSRHGRR